MLSNFVPLQPIVPDQPTVVNIGGKALTKQEKFGSGAFGVVYKVRDEQTFSDYALEEVLCLNGLFVRLKR